MLRQQNYSYLGTMRKFEPLYNDDDDDGDGDHDHDHGDDDDDDDDHVDQGWSSISYFTSKTMLTWAPCVRSSLYDDDDDDYDRSFEL